MTPDALATRVRPFSKALGEAGTSWCSSPGSGFPRIEQTKSVVSDRLLLVGPRFRGGVLMMLEPKPEPFPSRGILRQEMPWNRRFEMPTQIIMGTAVINLMPRTPLGQKNGSMS